MSSTAEGLYVKRVPGFLPERPAGVICALGADPGGVTAFFLAAWRDGQRKPYLAGAWQCDAGRAPELLEWILAAHGHLIQAAGVEAFTPHRSARGAAASGMVTLVSCLAGIVTAAGIPVAVRPASLVKPWATDKRLKTAGLAEACGKMTDDAADAARHCLYCACAELGLRDPLSTVRGSDDAFQGTG